MFSLFKKKDKLPKDKPSIYFSGQRPKERIDNFILEFIKPILEKKLFDFKKSDFSFYKEQNDFRQVVHFRRSVYNASDEIVRFDIMFSLFDTSYNRWHKKYYGTKATTNQLLGRSGAHIKNWDTKFMDNVWYNLTSVDNDKIIERINHNLTSVAVPILDRLSNRNNAINDLRLTSCNICPLLFDYCFIENDRETAKKILDDFKSYLNSKFSSQYPDQIHLFEERLKAYKNWV